MQHPNYIIITAARNEENFLDATIQSMIKQTILPAAWYIVSDNSTDNTDEIIKSYLNDYAFIKYIRLEKQDNRDFASKVFALNTIIDQIDLNDYDFIGILDADITFRPDYYESMFKEFNNDSKLGIAGGEFFDILDNEKIRVMKSSQSVRGGVQLFRKACFQEIGKFVPLKKGGEDIITEVTARKNGWTVKSFEHQMLNHHRLTGTGGWNLLEAKFNEGYLAYSMGYHPLFQFLKSIHRLKERPYIVSGILHFLGFFWAFLKREKRVVPEEFVNYLRKEQLGRMKALSV